MQKILIFSLMFLAVKLQSQEQWQPEISRSLGLDNHTNRDIAYFTRVDSSKNTFIVGTTENDSTFTDIITIKLNSENQEIWQRQFSIDTDLSYDIPTHTFLSDKDELYIVGRSSLNRSKSTGLIFIAKYNANGDLVFKKTIGDILGNDYVDYNYMNANLGEDGVMSLVYSSGLHTSLENHKAFNLIKLNDVGNVVEDFTYETVFQDVISDIKEGVFYLFTMKPRNEYSNRAYFTLHTITGKNKFTSYGLKYSETVKFYWDWGLHNVNLVADDNGLCHLTSSVEQNQKNQMRYTAIDGTKQSHNAAVSTEDQNYAFVSSFIDKGNEPVIIANDVEKGNVLLLGTDDEYQYTEFTKIQGIQATGFKYNDDGTFYLTTSNANIHLFTKDFKKIHSFQTSNTFELRDFFKVNDEKLVTVGTIHNKMFATSDFATQQDIHLELVRKDGFRTEYSFSGNGTSRNDQIKVILDNEGNPLVFSREKLGPESWYQGASNAPFIYRITKYDKDLNLLWEFFMPAGTHNIIGQSGIETPHFFDQKNILYLNLSYTNEQGQKKFKLFAITPNGDSFDFANSYEADIYYVDDDFIYLGRNYWGFNDTSKLYILNKANGELINTVAIGKEKFIGIHSEESFYFYSYSEISNRPAHVHLYKDGIKIGTHDLTTNNNIYPNEIDKEGSLYFSTSVYSDHVVNKLDLDNNLASHQVNEKVVTLKAFDESIIYVQLKDGTSEFLNRDFQLTTKNLKPNINQIVLGDWGEYLLSGDRATNTVSIFDQNGTALKEFTIQDKLDPWYFKVNNKGELFTVKHIGGKVGLINQYSWSLGIINKYGNIHEALQLNEENSKKSTTLRAYPNPTTGKVALSLRKGSIQKALLYDTTGNLLKTYEGEQIDLSLFQPGLYLLKVLTDTNAQETIKIIKY